MIQVKKATDGEGKTTQTPIIRAYFNYINSGNYFLKASGKSSNGFGGDGCIGCSFQATKTEPKTSNKHPIVLAQNSGSSMTRLELPYVFFGLGRINNYIENFYFGISKTGEWFYSWSPIIPNSQLLLSAIDVDPTNWKIQIFINPTKGLWVIIICTASVLLALGVAIIYFHWKEKVEDRKENEKNFDIF